MRRRLRSRASGPDGSLGGRVSRSRSNGALAALGSDRRSRGRLEIELGAPARAASSCAGATAAAAACSGSVARLRSSSRAASPRMRAAPASSSAVCEAIVASLRRELPGATVGGRIA